MTLQRPSARSAVDRLADWEDSGAGWRVESLGANGARIALLACTGEQVDWLRSDDPELIAYVRARGGSSAENAAMDSTGPAPQSAQLADADYLRLADLREQVRSYLAWAEDEARRHGTTPMKFQLALAVRAATQRGSAGPTVSELADALHTKHHSVVGLIDRAEDAGLVARTRDTVHGSRVRVTLTPLGEERLAALAASHHAHLATIAADLSKAWAAFAPPDSP